MLAHFVNWKWECKYVRPTFPDKIFMQSPQNEWFVNLSGVLVIIKFTHNPLSVELTYFGEKFVTLSWNNINHFAILKYLYLNTFFVFPALSCGLKALGICTKGLWIKADFLCEVTLWKGHSTHKISLVNLYSELKAITMPPLERSNKGQKMVTHRTSGNSIFMHTEWTENLSYQRQVVQCHLFLIFTHF